MKKILGLVIIAFALVALASCQPPLDEPIEVPLNPVTVNYLAEEGGEIQGANLQSINGGGSTAGVLAVPHDGYVFVEWSDGYKQPFRVDQDVTEDMTVTAIFEEFTLVVLFVTDMNNIDAEVMSYEDFVAEDLPTLKINGFSFEGWYWDRSYTQPVDQTNKSLTQERIVYFESNYAYTLLFAKLTRPYKGLEFWIEDNVDDYDFSGYINVEPHFGYGGYYGRGYVPTYDEHGYPIAPEHYVFYHVTPYPDLSDNVMHVTEIEITDPEVEVYGLTVNSSVEEFIATMISLGFSIEENYHEEDEWDIVAKKGKITIELSSEHELIVDYAITNESGIVF